MDAERALLIQELEMTWRYSVGNTYEELSYAEALDVAQVMAEYGYGDVSRQILRYTLRRLPVPFHELARGRTSRCGRAVFSPVQAMPLRLRGDTGACCDRRRLARDVASNGLLPRERYSSDIPDDIYSLQGQTLVWQGLLAMSRVWARLGTRRSPSARVRLRCGSNAGSAGPLPRRSVGCRMGRSSSRRHCSTPCAVRTADRFAAGTYWNLVTPYALASGFFAPHGLRAPGLLRYLAAATDRGCSASSARAPTDSPAPTRPSPAPTRCMGSTSRASSPTTMSRTSSTSASTATLAAALTPGTFVAGEAASVSPLHGALYRTMYLPPNNDATATFLETLRLLLVHEMRGPEGLPRGLELAFATPRGWLARGKSIVVRAAPTSFGPISYSLTRTGAAVRVVVDPPASPQLRSLKLRLRLPGLTRALDLSGRRGRIELSVPVAQAR